MSSAVVRFLAFTASFRARQASSALLLSVLAAAGASLLDGSRAIAAIPPDVARQIAIAEDERRWDQDLRSRLADKNPEVRARAALAVGRLQDSTTVAGLLPLLDDSDPAVRREAVFALGQIGHRSAREALEARLGDKDAEVVQLAVEALGKLGDKAATPSVTRFLADRSATLRGEAAVALWRLADSTALDDLLGAHDDPDPEVRWRVIWALEKIVDPRRIVLQVANQLDDADWRSRAYAARTLGRQKAPRAEAYLIQAANDSDPHVAVNAIRALQGIGDSACAGCASALSRLLTRPDRWVRATAATALGDRFAWAGDSTRRRLVADSLSAHLADPDGPTRAAAARGLLAAWGEAALSRVRPLLADSSIYVRVAVMSALPPLMPGTDLEKQVRARLDPSTPLFERMTAAEVLGGWRGRGVAALLRAGLRDTSMLFAASCASGLAAARDSASVRALAEAYTARAAEAEPDARIAIRDALRELAGAAFADSVDKAHPAPPRTRGPYPADFAEPPAAKGALLRTTRGDIEWAFFGHEAPQTVKNFVRLAERHSFDGLAVHRVVPNFVIQDGDPTGTGSGGPGYTIRCEYNRLHYAPGMVGMALSGKDTGGSQWFITHSPQLHLDGRYTIFARVTKGMEVVDRIGQGDRVLEVRILR